MDRSDVKPQELPPADTTTICCSGKDCDASATTRANRSAVGAIAAETHYEIFFQHDGGLAWICPECWEKLVPAFERLKAVLGDAAALEPVHFLVRRWMEPPKKIPRTKGPRP